jgi:predicted Ser/Thr protein kinase
MENPMKTQIKIRSTLCSCLALVAFALPAQAGLARPLRPEQSALWASQARYKQAMHNPAHYLKDPKLANATVETDATSAPKARSGKFSSVYKFTTESGRVVAVRFFHPHHAADDTHGPQAIARKYAIVERTFEALRAQKRLPPEIIETAMVSGGIEIDGRRLPIQKLPWIGGRELDAWVERRLNQNRPEALAALAENFRATVQELQALGIAHGDLHHGNIKIDGENTYFIDYDAMFVPELAGGETAEIGHPHYQHPGLMFPQPTRRAFDARMDHFSSTVIYLSLIALTDNPRLWDAYHDEASNHLIFDTFRDYQKTSESPLFRELLASANPVVRGLARKLIAAIQGSPQNVPSLEQSLTGLVAPLPGAEAPIAPEAAVPTAVVPAAPPIDPAAEKTAPGFLARMLQRLQRRP